MAYQTNIPLHLSFSSLKTKLASKQQQRSVYRQRRVTILVSELVCVRHIWLESVSIQYQYRYRLGAFPDDSIVS